MIQFVFSFLSSSRSRPRSSPSNRQYGNSSPRNTHFFPSWKSSSMYVTKISIHVYIYRRSGNLHCEKIFGNHLRQQKLNRRNIFYTYKWTEFILWSGDSDKNKPRRKFNRQNILPTKNFRSTVHAHVYTCTCTYVQLYFN